MSASRALLAVAAALAYAAPGLAQTTTAVSVDSGGVLSDSFSFSPSISADGRFVAFSSGATNLVTGDTNFAPDVFLRDRLLSTTVRVSVSYLGLQGDSISWFPSVSADGRYVAFGSFSTNMVPGDTNGWIDAFVRDTQTGTTTIASVSTAGVQGDASVGTVVLSADGRFVAFDSDATNLVAGDTNAVADIFLHDTQTGITTRMSVTTGGVQANGPSLAPNVSADGRYVAFSSDATNLVAGDTNLGRDIFVRDTLLNTTTRVSLTNGGAQTIGGDSAFSSMSGDGRYVAFESDASNLVAGDTNQVGDIFVRDTVASTTTRASLSSLGAQGDGFCGGSSISASGRFVTFYSLATNLVTPATNGQAQVFVRDMIIGSTTLVSQDSSGVQGADGSYFSAVSSGGNVVAFESYAGNLVAGDMNFESDVFARESGGPPIASICPGDGTGTACPCANHGGAGRGCAHSANASGALIAGVGGAIVSADSLVLSGSGVPNGPGLYFQGSTTFGGGSGVPFGDGLLCASGAIVRLGIVFASGNASQYPRPGLDPAISVAGAVAAGDLRHYQLWFRDADTTFCTSAVFNLTNAVSLTWGP